MLLALRQVMSGGPALPTSVGVTWGRVFAGEVGTPYRRTYTVMGDTVNLAARLMARAPAGEIYATAEVVEGLTNHFRCERPRAIHGQGQETPGQCGFGRGSAGEQEPTGSRWATPRSGVTRSWHCSPPPGRRARAGNGQMVELAADAGMGKSRLVEEFLATTQPDRVIHTECRLYQSATPYFPFRELLSRGLGTHGPGSRCLGESPVRAGRHAGTRARPVAFPDRARVGIWRSPTLSRCRSSRISSVRCVPWPLSVLCSRRR